jgi:hypothetical protein
MNQGGGVENSYLEKALTLLPANTPRSPFFIYNKYRLDGIDP